jgi:hypothetical protein
LAANSVDAPTTPPISELSAPIMAFWSAFETSRRTARSSTLIWPPATALGAGISMAFSERLSDTGDLTSRGSPVTRGAVTGLGTFVGGVFHTVPFLIADYRVAMAVAVLVVAVELVVLTVLRAVAFRTSLARSFLAVTVGGRDHRRRELGARRRRLTGQAASVRPHGASACRNYAPPVRAGLSFDRALARLR